MNRKLERSPALLQRDKSALLVIDLQERLLPSIADHARIVWNTGRLLDGAKILGIPVEATEQYPQGLGPTVSEIRDRIDRIGSKRVFSCLECAAIFEGLASQGIEQLLLVGIESHVCVLQTALDLVSAGFDVFVAVDASGSRHAIDRETALQRMHAHGVTLTTTESALFEWCATSLAPEFKAISQLVRQNPPEGRIPAP